MKCMAEARLTCARDLESTQISITPELVMLTRMSSKSSLARLSVSAFTDEFELTRDGHE